MSDEQPPEWAPLPSTTPRKERVLVTVKAYPNPSTKYIETVCVAGVTQAGNWIRLYPIPYRFLEYDKQFRTYAWIEVDVRKSRDFRPESHYINIDTLKVTGVLDRKDKWKARCDTILPLASQSIEVLKDQNRLVGTSLGLIRPKTIRRLLITSVAPSWSSEALAKLQRESLFDGLRDEGTRSTIQMLEKIPHSFQYQFTCDDVRCHGHKMAVISWEVMQTYRNFRQQYREGWEAKFREMYEKRLLDSNHDLHFYVGTVSGHPNTWTIIGLFYPPPQRSVEPTQLTLFGE